MGCVKGVDIAHFYFLIYLQLGGRFLLKINKIPIKKNCLLSKTGRDGARSVSTANESKMT